MPSGLFAGSGVRGIAFYECGDVFGDGHVVSVCEFDDAVFEGWGDFEGEGGCFACCFFGWSSVACHLR